MRERHQAYVELLIRILISAITAITLSAASVRAAAPTEACSLLSQQEVNAAAGFSVAPADKAFKTVCTWNAPGKGLTGKSVQVSYLSEKVYEAGKTMPGATTKSEPGLGDEAYFIIQAAFAPRST